MDNRLKNLVGRVPAAVAAYDALARSRPRTRYNLEQLAAHLPEAVEEARERAGQQTPGRRLLIFATLHYWIEQAAIVALVLRGLGHEVAVAYLPYSDWRKDINAFDLERQDMYTRRVLAPLDGFVRVLSLRGVKPSEAQPTPLMAAVERAAGFDVMYSLQREEVDRDSALFRLRLNRNGLACAAALECLREAHPDAVIIPNGLVTELGVFYQAARFHGTKAITYEFNDQREQIWIAHDDIVMRQNTDELWKARASRQLEPTEWTAIRDLEEARQGGRIYGKGTRRWQDSPGSGSDVLRSELMLDERPVVLLATNVLGDSLALGRNLFASSMAEWIEKTVRFFVNRPEVQLLVRVHPGERLTKGQSMVQVVERAAAYMPEHIHVIGPHETANTYDIMEIAGLGLVYTTTVGLEMAMRGVPVIVAGQTHYRGRGFALEPSTWDEYYEMLDRQLKDIGSGRLTAIQVEAAWRYAYQFFFEYPFDFPWRLMQFWRDYESWPVRRVLSDEGRAAFGDTFDHLAGEAIEW